MKARSTLPIKRELIGLVNQIFADTPTETVAEWAARELRFDEPDNRGPFRLEGRHYVIEWLEFVRDPALSDATIVSGTQAGKTSAIMAMAAWLIRHKKPRIFWVMPTRDTVAKFSRTRWLPLLRNSHFEVPEGYDRFEFSTFAQQVEGAVIDMVWAGSPAGLRSVPARVVILDETSAFPENVGGEGDTIEKAWERTKNAALPKRIDTSTPVLTEDFIWQRYLRSDQRRRYLPCPHCGKHVLLLWSKEFTVFPLQGCEAFVRWDQSARRQDDTWDLDRVAASAHAECPHCGGHITDAHKTKMDREGVWKPTANAASGVRGWHLSSLYSCASQCSFGRLAVKFLQLKDSPQGLQSFINSDLAEPWENQEQAAVRIELMVREDSQPLDGAQRIMTVDYQEKHPYFWYVVRAWNQHSRLIAWGSLGSWNEVRQVQQKYEVPDWRVFVDSGYQPSEVYEMCMRYGRTIARQGVDCHLGWTPCKGFDGRQHWVDREGKRRVYNLAWAAVPGDKRCPLLEFGSNPCQDILERLRRKKTATRWEVVEELVNDIYWRHLDSEVLRAVQNPRTGKIRYEYQRRSKKTPNHLRDCETMQIAAAIMTGLLRPEEGLLTEEDLGEPMESREPDGSLKS